MGEVLRFDPDLSDVILGIQAVPSARDPIKRLYAAILEAAWHDLRLKADTPMAQYLRHKARSWFDDDTPTDWPGAFRNVCHTLGVSPDFIRRRLPRSHLSSTRMRQCLTTTRRQSPSPGPSYRP